MKKPTILYVDRNRGYLLLRKGRRYAAGCRDFASRAEALAHGGSPNYPDPERGAAYCAAIRAGAAVASFATLRSDPAAHGTASREIR